MKSRKQLQTVALYDSLEAMIVLPAFFHFHSLETGTSSIGIVTEGISVVSGGENGSFIFFNI